MHCWASLTGSFLKSHPQLYRSYTEFASLRRRPTVLIITCPRRQSESLPSGEILDNLQRLLIVITMNSAVPFLANHEFCARWPPFGQEISVRYRDLRELPRVGET